MLDTGTGVRRAHAREQLRHAEHRERVAWIVRPAQHRHQVLDVRGFEELQSAVLRVRDLAFAQLDFEHVAVARAAEQHGLAPQRHVGFAPAQNLRADILSLRLQIIHRHQLGAYAFATRGQQVLAMLARRIGHQRVGYVEDFLGGTVVLRQDDDFGFRIETIGEAEDVLHGCRAERIDGLGVVADHGEPRSVRPHRVQDLRLQLVGILVFVDQHMIEVRAHVLGQARLRHHDVPVQQQVVVIENRRALLLLDVGPIQARQIRFPLRAPGILLLQRFLQRPLGIDAIGIDLQAGFLARENAAPWRRGPTPGAGCPCRSAESPRSITLNCGSSFRCFA